MNRFHANSVVTLKYQIKQELSWGLNMQIYCPHVQGLILHVAELLPQSALIHAARGAGPHCLCAALEFSAVCERQRGRQERNCSEGSRVT